MRSMVKLVWVVAVSLAAGGCSSARTPVSLTHASVLAKAGLQSYWHVSLNLQAGEKVERLFLIDENLYCLTDTNYLLAVDAAKGVRKWSRKIAEPGVKVYPPCHGNAVHLEKELPGVVKIATPVVLEALPAFDLVLVNTPDYMLAFDRGTGELRRKITFDGRPDEFVASTGGGCDGRFYYVGATNGRCYAFRLNEGVFAWILRTGELLSAAPKCHNPGGSQRVFLGGEDGEYYVLKAGSLLAQVWPPEGSRNWAAMAGPVTAEFHVDDRACFIPCVNRRVYAFSLGGGAALWRFTCGGPLADNIQVSDNTVFQYARGDKLYAIDPANGKMRWAMRKGRRVLASMSAGDVPMTYLVDDAGSLLVVDEILGKVRASIPLTGVDLFADNTSAPAVYLGSRGGGLYCLRQLDAGHLTEATLRKIKPKKAPAAP